MLAERNLSPGCRGEAVAAALRQFGAACGDLPLTMSDCAKGYTQLASMLRDEEPTVVKVRRTTYSELAELAGDPTGGSESRLIAVFHAFYTRFKESEDDRLASLAMDAAREACELSGD